jgi:hypothetical protein
MGTVSPRTDAKSASHKHRSLASRIKHLWNHTKEIAAATIL